MFKRLKELFKTQPANTSPSLEPFKLNPEHIVAWALACSSIGISNFDMYARMVDEPVTMLLKSLRAKHTRFRVKPIDFETYKSLTDAQVYNWMNRCHFYKFTDTLSGMVKTVVMHDGELYRVDDLPFHLNGWELRVLYEGFKRAKSSEAVRERLREQRRKRQEKARLAQQEVEKKHRLEYAKVFE